MKIVTYANAHARVAIGLLFVVWILGGIAVEFSILPGWVWLILTIPIMVSILLLGMMYYSRTTSNAQL